MTKDTKQWYASWFDTPFYHILYKNRDQKEAQSFMESLTSYINLPADGTILDLACGRGRHSVYLNSIGYKVIGLDLSPHSIKFARQFENDTLHFDVHDMSKPYSQQFDAVFNLFTSFGYFENDEGNLNTIKAIKANLKPNAVGVIDFMNINFVKQHLISNEKKTVEDITFYLERKIENGFVVKNISFDVDSHSYKFSERVRAFNLQDFKSLFKLAGVELIDIFGNYKLNKFDSKNSDRLIMLFK